MADAVCHRDGFHPTTTQQGAWVRLVCPCCGATAPRGRNRKKARRNWNRRQARLRQHS